MKSNRFVGVLFGNKCRWNLLFYCIVFGININGASNRDRWNELQLSLFICFYVQFTRFFLPRLLLMLLLKLFIVCYFILCVSLKTSPVLIYLIPNKLNEFIVIYPQKKHSFYRAQRYSNSWCSFFYLLLAKPHQPAHHTTWVQEKNISFIRSFRHDSMLLKLIPIR